jgi:hypothetical protein
MANNLPITDLTNGLIANNEWTGTGVFDVLLDAINKNIEVQYENGRIVGKDYAQVYLGGIQSTLQQSVDFLLKKELTYWQIEVAQKELEIKQLEVGIKEQELELAKLELKEKYVDRVIKDKEAAKLGLDNVVKNMEEERIINPDMIYKPQYTEII